MTATGHRLEVERVEDRRTIESIRTAWDELLDRNETRTADLTPAWQLAFWDQFGADSRLFTLVVRDGGEILAIAPLKLRKSRDLGVPVRYLEFIAAGESNYQDFIIGGRREEVLDSILDYLVLHRSQWDVLHLRNLPEQSTTARYVLDAPTRRDRSVVSWVGRTIPCMYMEINGTWEQYCKGSAKMRSKIAYKRRKLQKLGSIAVLHSNDEREFQVNLSRFFDLHRSRWEGTDTPSQFHDDRYCRFYRSAGLLLLPKKQIDLFMLELDARPVAGLLTLHYGRGCVQQLTAYDPEYAHASPSLVMHELYVEELFAGDARVFDFGHYYAYKEAWADSFKNTVDIKLHLGGIVPRYDQMASSLLQQMREWLRKHGTLLKVARSARGLLRRRSSSPGGGPGR